MGEQSGELIGRTRRPAQRVLAALLGRDDDPAAVIYGVITVGAVLAAEGSRNETYPRSIGASVLILLLYWIVHAWSIDTGDRIKARRPFTWEPMAERLRVEWSIMRGSVIPIVAVLIAGFSGATDRTAVLIGTFTSAVMLVIIEFAAAVRNQLAPRQILIQTAAGAMFGCGLIALRFIVH